MMPIKLFSCENLILFVCISIQILIPSECLDFDTVYMESDCGTSISMLTSFQLESSTGLTYKNQLDCTYTVSAPAGHVVFAIITRFELEPALSGTCSDYVNFHDGTTTGAATLNSALVCGSGSSIASNYTSTGQSMTLRFVTDNSGTYLGFSINFVAATTGVCSSSQFTCNTSICIDGTLQCDTYNQCGDSSDEDNCTVSSSEASNIVMIVIISLVALAVVAVIIGYVAYRIHAKNKWKKFINMHIDDDNGIVAPAPSYPITHLYYKGIKGHPRVYESNVKIEKNSVESKTGANLIAAEVSSSKGAKA